MKVPFHSSPFSADKILLWPRRRMGVEFSWHVQREGRRQRYLFTSHTMVFSAGPRVLPNSCLVWTSRSTRWVAETTSGQFMRKIITESPRQKKRDRFLLHFCFFFLNPARQTFLHLVQKRKCAIVWKYYKTWYIVTHLKKVRSRNDQSSTS